MKRKAGVKWVNKVFIGENENIHRFALTDIHGSLTGKSVK